MKSIAVAARLAIGWRSSRLVVRRAVAMSLTLLLAFAATAAPALAAPALPVLWTAGGLDAGTTGAGQAARIATDLSGNVAVVSGPTGGSSLAITSYSSTGLFRWRATVSPSSGTFVGDWVAAAPNGDIVAVGHTTNSSGNPIQITIARYSSAGVFQWHTNIAGTLPGVGRLLVDSSGNSYLAFNSIGDGQDIRLHKYDAAGVLVWAQVISTGSFANEIASSLAFSPDETEVALSGSISGGSTWITALYDGSTGSRKWLVTADDGTAARDLVVDSGRVYVTGLGNVGISQYLTTIAYDRTTGAKLWRTDKRPADAASAAGLRMSLAPDGSLVVTGQASRGFLDWYTVALETTGAVRWEAVRDGGLNTDEIPAAVAVLADGTAVVSGTGGPNLPGGFIGGVTAGYGPSGSPLWEAFSSQATKWVIGLPTGAVCATGGYDALITCWQTQEVDSPPTVSIDSPVTGALVSGTITVTTTATDDNGVSGVEIFVDGVSIGFDVGTGVSWDTTTATNASHTIAAVATDTIGQTATSSVSVTVSNGGTITEMHVGDLDGLALDLGNGRFEAKVTVKIHDSAEAPVSGATVGFSYALRSRTFALSCTTDGAGSCTVTSRKVSTRVGPITFTVTGVSRAGLTYVSGSNHDPETDSNGTVITVSPPL